MSFRFGGEEHGNGRRGSSMITGSCELSRKRYPVRDEFVSVRLARQPMRMMLMPCCRRDGEMEVSTVMMEGRNGDEKPSCKSCSAATAIAGEPLRMHSRIPRNPLAAGESSDFGTATVTR